MTPEEQYKLLRETSVEIKAAVDNAYQELIKQIRAGKAPREAVQAVMDGFAGEYAEIMAAGLGVVIGESVGDAAAIEVGTIKLSSRLYAQGEATSSIVEGVVRKHVRGFSDARALALELYEGYDFNPIEPLEIVKGNDALPKYMREALLEDPATTNGLKRAYARAQTKALRTGHLKAAYTELLNGIDAVEKGAGADFLDKKLKVAFNEKMRYFANRIAQTELQRAYAEAQAKEFMADSDIKYVQWRLSPNHPEWDICDYFAGVNRYGLGPGVYPKAFAPVAPAHPHCKCVLSPRLDLNGKSLKDITDAEGKYFGKLPPDVQRKVAGSERKLDRVKAGETAWQVHNSKIDPIYQVKTVSQIN